jgi:phospholipid/cholesterol/gamma-HCH transport system permease protein
MTQRPLITRPLQPAGALFAFGLDTVRAVFRRPFQWHEFVDQAWFITRVSLLPACLITIPFGATMSLQLGSLLKQLGAESYLGAAATLATVQQSAPIATVVVVAGAAGTAVAAEMGSRKIREELDAMAVLGIAPIHRLVVPRVLAMVVIAFLLNLIVCLAGIVGSYLYVVYTSGGSGGAFLQSATSLTQLADMWVGQLKAAIFGLIAGIVACHQGMNAKGGPSGVGTAVNQGVIISFVLLFIVNTVLTAVYYQLVPPKGL